MNYYIGNIETSSCQFLKTSRETSNIIRNTLDKEFKFNKKGILEYLFFRPNSSLFKTKKKLSMFIVHLALDLFPNLILAPEIFNL